MTNPIHDQAIEEMRWESSKAFSLLDEKLKNDAMFIQGWEAMERFLPLLVKTRDAFLAERGWKLIPIKSNLTVPAFKIDFGQSLWFDFDCDGAREEDAFMAEPTHNLEEAPQATVTYLKDDVVRVTFFNSWALTFEMPESTWIVRKLNGPSPEDVSE